LARQQRFDYLLIESTGISEPLPVAETFAFLDKDGRCLSELARLDTMVTVVDGANFSTLLSSEEQVKVQEGTANETKKSLSGLLIEQIEFADVLLISKADLITAPRLAQLQAQLHALNPAAQILPMVKGDIPLPAIMDTRRFNLAGLARSPGWQQKMDGAATASEADTYGVMSCVYRDRSPFHPGRLFDFLRRDWTNGTLLRSKGYFWVANQYLDIGMLVQTGGAFQWGYVGRWWRFIAEADWPRDDYRRDAILAKWDEAVGDCRQEIVFIGQGIDVDALRTQLDACRLSDDEIVGGPELWMALPGAEKMVAATALKV
jgi:G3E family GTPase